MRSLSKQYVTVSSILFSIAITLAACLKPTNSVKPEARIDYPNRGHIERLDPRIDQLIPISSKIEVLSDGYTWTEGPLWIAEGQYLIFSDIPNNRIMKWSKKGGSELYLHPAGYTGTIKRGGETGSNGLLLDDQGSLVLCQHGDRRMAKMLAPIQNPEAKFETLVEKYDGKRFNSPNDATYDRDGNLYFTDPPYGLEGKMKDPSKELDYQGVYRYSVDGVVSLIADDISRPNGIALSPDEQSLYVSSSEGHPMWTKFTISDDGEVINKNIFYDSTDAQGLGAPDGLKVDKQGNVWATGPGGVWVFDDQGVVLGKIHTGERTSNCVFDNTESYLYMTCDDYLMRIKLK